MDDKDKAIYLQGKYSMARDIIEDMQKDLDEQKRTLRDEIAIAAMQGILSNPTEYDAELSQFEIAEVSYSIADVMLSQREIKDD